MSEKAQNFTEAVLFCVFMVVFVWLYCRATPAQMSAEYDLAAEAGVRAAHQQQQASVSRTE